MCIRDRLEPRLTANETETETLTATTETEMGILGLGTPLFLSLIHISEPTRPY